MPKLVDLPLPRLSFEMSCAKENVKQFNLPSKSSACWVPLVRAASRRACFRALAFVGGGKPSGALHSNAMSGLELGLADSGTNDSCVVLICSLEKWADLVWFLSSRKQGIDDMFGAGGGRTRLRSDPTCHPLLATSRNATKAALLSAGSSELGTWLATFLQSL